MHPDPVTRQRGFGLAGAIALLVVVALFAASAVRLAETSATSQGAQAQALRAFFAAQAGASLAMNRLFPPAGGGTCADRSFILDEIGMTACSANVTCTTSTSGGRSFYRLVATGTCGSGVNQAVRTIEVGASP